jgi:hypothetical protein
MMELLLLPDSAELRSCFSDFGFTSRSGHIYIDAEAAYLFTLISARPNAEPAQALQQLEEHLLASYIQDGETYYLTDSPSDELMHRIALAYGCEARQVLV